MQRPISIPAPVRVVAACVLIAGGALLAVFLNADDAEAQLRCGHEIIYYADAEKTEAIGYQAWEPVSCGCTYWSWGTISVYRDVLPLSSCF